MNGSLTTLVDNIEHIESTTFNGRALVKVYLQPDASLDTANAQVTAARRPFCVRCRPGTQPPSIMNYSASSVPILQLGLSGQGLSEQELNDLGLEFPAHAAGDRAGRCRAVSLWRQAAPGGDQSGSPQAAGERTVSRRCSQCGPAPEPGTALRHGENRSDFEYDVRVNARHRNADATERSADQDRRQCDDLSPRCCDRRRRLLRRRPMSCDKTGGAACL